MIKNNIPDAVCWREGMRLTPQHFQQQALRHERLSAYLLGLVQPYFWGVLSIEYNFSGTRFEITSLEAIMPDGLVVAYKATNFETTNIESLKIDLASLKSDKNGAYSIFIAVKASICAVKQDHADRFRKTLSLPISDSNTGSSDVVISVLQPILLLVCGASSSYDEYDLLPLARYTKLDGSYTATSFIPPSPRISEILAQTSALYNNVKGVCNLVRDKYNYFVTQFANNQRAGETQKATDSQWKISILGARLLELEALIDTSPHPQQIYLLLCALLGIAASADPEQGLPYILPFDYSDMSICMDDVMSQIKTRLAFFSPAYERLYFSYDGHRSFLLNCKLLPHSVQFYIGLRLPPEKTEVEMSNWLNAAVIASSSKISVLDHNRVAGIQRSALDIVQAVGYEVGSDIRLFQLDMTGNSSIYFDPNSDLQIVGSSSPLISSLMPREIFLLQKNDLPMKTVNGAKS